MKNTKSRCKKIFTYVEPFLLIFRLHVQIPSQTGDSERDRNRKSSLANIVPTNLGFHGHSRNYFRIILMKNMENKMMKPKSRILCLATITNTRKAKLFTRLFACADITTSRKISCKIYCMRKQNMRTLS